MALPWMHAVVSTGQVDADATRPKQCQNVLATNDSYKHRCGVHIVSDTGHGEQRPSANLPACPQLPAQLDAHGLHMAWGGAAATSQQYNTHTRPRHSSCMLFQWSHTNASPVSRRCCSQGVVPS
jgi:hypothetical protein